jgi:glucose-fructose oxidoreductase
MNPRYRIAGINFDHFHMGDLLRMAHEHPDAEIVGICDEKPERMDDAARQFGPRCGSRFHRLPGLLGEDEAGPRHPLSCGGQAWRLDPASSGIRREHPRGKAVCCIAGRGGRDGRGPGQARKSVGDQLADPMGALLYHSQTSRREGTIGTVTNVFHYGGNRGPLCHGADKVVKIPTPEEKSASWFYQKDEGGGSMLDYLGYGTTMSTWFHGGKKPIEVTAVVDQPPGLEVDEHSITIARYDVGLSKFEDALGHVYRSLDPTAAAQVRLRHLRYRGDDQRLRLTRLAFGSKRTRIPNGGNGRWTR